MNTLTKLVTFLSVIGLLLIWSSSALAVDKPNKKRGQVYYRMVCTVCHKASVGRTISPAEFTMEQWSSYFDVGAHDKSGKVNSSLLYYTSVDYRKSISASNKAAKRFMKLGNEQLFADLRKFTVAGAKDSDTPATCN